MRDNGAVSYQSISGKRSDANVETLLGIMSANLFGKLTLSDISKQSGMSQAAISALFSRYFKCGVLDYFFRMKIEAAKNTSEKIIIT